jgi:hypothetical protein
MAANRKTVKVPEGPDVYSYTYINKKGSVGA